MIRRPIRHLRNRRRLDPSQRGETAIVLVTPTVTGANQATLTYSAPVSVNAQPNFTAAGIAPTSFLVTGPNTVQVNFAGAVAGDAWVQSSLDPAVRSYTGGYVAAATGTFPP